MHTRTLSTVLLLMLATTALADEAADIVAFNSTWQAYVAAKETDDAKAKLAAAKRLVDLGKKVIPDGDERLPMLLTNYGVLLFQGKNPGSAIDVFDEALDLAEDIYGDKSEKLVFYLENSAGAVGKAGDDRKQRTLLYRAARIGKHQYGPDSLDYGDLEYRAGVSFMSSASARDAKRFLTKAEDVFREHTDAGAERNSLVAFWLGKAEMAEGHNRAATDYLLTALAGFKEVDKPMTSYELAAHGHLVYAYEERGMSDAATEHCLAIGARRPDRTDAEFLPVFRMAPRYPEDMLRSGIQGHVDFKFTVDKSGFVRDPVVVDRDGGSSFESAAQKVVERFRYAPQFENGQPVAVDGVKTRITFKIAQ